MIVYVIVSESGITYGVFTLKEAAEKERQSIYDGGYFGSLEIAEDWLYNEDGAIA